MLYTDFIGPYCSAVRQKQSRACLEDLLMGARIPHTFEVHTISCMSACE